MISCLLRVIRFGRFLHPFQAQAWLFPAESASGHMAEGKEDRGELSKWGDDLRQSYRTLAAIARVSEVDAKLLMNHAIPGVNSGYITRHKLLEDHLRSQQQAISDVIFKPIRADVAKPGAVRAWLGPHATRKAMEEAGAQGPIGRNRRNWTPKRWRHEFASCQDVVLQNALHLAMDVGTGDR